MNIDFILPDSTISRENRSQSSPTEFNFQILSGQTVLENNGIILNNYSNFIGESIQQISHGKLLSIEIVFRYIVGFKMDFITVFQQLEHILELAKDNHINKLKCLELDVKWESLTWYIEVATTNSYLRLFLCKLGTQMIQFTKNYKVFLENEDASVLSFNMTYAIKVCEVQYFMANNSSYESTMKKAVTREAELFVRFSAKGFLSNRKS